MTVDEFRVAYPAFADADGYTAARIEYWLHFAEVMTNSRRWIRSGLRDQGIGLLTAHYMSISETAKDAVTGAASIPTAGAGAKISDSQTADGVSYTEGYDSTAYAGAGQLASTWYGQQFLDLRSLIGAGGFQL